MFTSQTIKQGICHIMQYNKRDRLSTKVRIVFDASAKYGPEPSLNDCILQGPALQPNLVSILIRF